ncbi:MAG: hypothetical protein NC826_03985 [Candidatus Omnitrophica bacterium]|nr:hypothetical protein [Candidatus Omnitrophota bacterium]
MFSKIEGSYCMLLLKREAIYAVRDRYDYMPLVVGRKQDSWVVTTEITTFDNIIGL